MTAYLNIDEVIRIVREEDEPKRELMQRFSLSDTQAEAILDLRLRRLAKLEEIKIRGELDELQEERESLQRVLGSDTRLRNLVKEEIRADMDKFGDVRRSPLEQREEAKALDETQLMPTEQVTVILSEKGWVRAAKGHDIDPETLNYRAGDGFRQAAMGRSNQFAVFLDSTGRCYSIASHILPSARSHGEPVSSWVTPPDGAVFNGVMLGESDKLYFLSTDAGYGFVARLGDLYVKAKAGKAVLNVPQSARVLPPRSGRRRQTGPGGGRHHGRAPAGDGPGRIPATGQGQGGQGHSDTACQVEEPGGIPGRAHRVRQKRQAVPGIRQAPPDLESQGLGALLWANAGRRGNVLPRGYRQVSSIKPKK